QYALNLRGGGSRYNYQVSSGFDKDHFHTIGDEAARLNLSIRNMFKPHKNIQLRAGLWYTLQQRQNNGLELGDLTSIPQIGVSPYMRLRNNDGMPLAIIRSFRASYIEQAEDIGLLDWQYRPLDEIRLADNTSKSSQLRLTLGTDITLPEGFTLSL